MRSVQVSKPKGPLEIIEKVQRISRNCRKRYSVSSSPYNRKLVIATPRSFIMRSSNEAPNVKLSTVATFPKNYFLENLAVRSDNSVLVTVLNHKELWYVPSSNDEQPVEPELLFTFPQPAMGIVEVEPDVFHISVSDIYRWKESYLYRLDLNGWV